ncbi:10943_t:CDS:2 [Gigaspora margarita]|uniref:10943_t:CDS:1 n=1 Tax=Gigaspora margarita TaxID=4874 RepID=A0ABN7TYG1_GIGMA|nr:10943_t:CDS:2 [Gigaspora margarita]
MSHELEFFQRYTIFFLYSKNKPLCEELSQEQRSQTVYDTINRYNKTGSEHPSKCPGHQEVLSECNKCALLHIANNNCSAPLAVNMNELNLQLGMTLTTKTT